MGIVAILPSVNLAAANAALSAWGPGPHFSVPAYANVNPTYGCLHDWGTVPAYVAAIKARPGVVFDEGAGDPAARLRTLLAVAASQWGDDAPPLPASGNALANTLYSYNTTELWWCIQTFNRTIFDLSPSNYPALIRRARRPGEILPWVQPIDQFDSYYVVNPFNGLPDRVTHNGKTWDSLIANNTFTPGVANWREFVEDGFPAWLQPTGAGDAYPVGFRVSHLSQNWQNTSPANTFAPGVFGWTVV